MADGTDMLQDGLSMMILQDAGPKRWKNGMEKKREEDDMKGWTCLD